MRLVGVFVCGMYPEAMDTLYMLDFEGIPGQFLNFVHSSVIPLLVPM